MPVNYTNKLYILSDYELRKECWKFYRKPYVTVGFPFYRMKTDFQHPYRGGLYDEAIFGFENQCHCAIDKRQTYEDQPVQCPSCHRWVYSTDEYAKNFGLFEMPIPIVKHLNVNALWIELKTIFGDEFPPKGMKSSLSSLWSLYLYESDTPEPLIGQDYDDNPGETLVEPIEMYNKDGKLTYIMLYDLPGESSGTIPTKDRLGHPISVENMGLLGLEKLSKYVFTNGKQCSIISSLINRCLPIISPALRKLTQVPNYGGEPILAVPTITDNYRIIIEYSRYITKYLGMKNLSITDKATYCWFFNVILNSHFASNQLLLSSKQSLTRTIMDSRVSNSLRGIIVASVDRPMDTIGLPETAVYKCMKKHIVNRIVDYLSDEEDNLNTKPEDIIKDARELYTKRDPLAWKIFKQSFEPHIDEDGNEVIPAMCLAVRNPTLHKYNEVAFKIELLNDTAIHFPVTSDEGMNADHL